jgi:hypothetical protein
MEQLMMDTDAHFSQQRRLVRRRLYCGQNSFLSALQTSP